MENVDDNVLEESDYELAILVQSACNLSGVVFSFERVMKKICHEAKNNNHGTDWKNHHPICRLFAEQIMHLTQKTDYEGAYKYCEEKSRPEVKNLMIGGE
jgi:hypothetical protein